VEDFVPVAEEGDRDPHSIVVDKSVWGSSVLRNGGFSKFPKGASCTTRLLVTVRELSFIT